MKGLNEYNPTKMKFAILFSKSLGIKLTNLCLNNAEDSKLNARVFQCSVPLIAEYK